MAPDYKFYAAQLRFVASRTEAETPEIKTMMRALDVFADKVEAGEVFEVPGKMTQITGRALAGVGGFLQQHILPEVVAAKNKTAERQVRWVIDTSMELTAILTVHAETVGENKSRPIILPPPP
jgi:hypothetical protein